MGRDVHHLTFSVQHFLCRPRRRTPSKVSWRMACLLLSSVLSAIVCGVVKAKGFSVHICYKWIWHLLLVHIQKNESLCNAPCYGPSGCGKILNGTMFSDIGNVINVSLCIMTLLVVLYSHTSLSVIVITFQGQSSIKTAVKIQNSIFR